MKLAPGKALARILLAAAIPLVFSAARARGDEIPKGWQSTPNLKPIGYTDMDGRGGNVKMAIKHVGDHWYMYVSHMWQHGWTILDVTDATNPKVVKFIPGPPNGDTNQQAQADAVAKYGQFGRVKVASLGKGLIHQACRSGENPDEIRISQ